MKKNFKASKIIFNSLNVDLMENNSGIFIGKNRPLYWSSTEKSLSGFGTINGQKNDISQNIHLILNGETENHAVEKEEK